MNKSEFIDAFKESLEIENVEVKEETDLRDLPQYDSLAVLSIIALVDEKFKRKMKGQDFKTITTLRSLMEFIGMENFE